MFSGRDRGRRPYVRWAVVGLIVAVSTVTADLATFIGPLDDSRIVLLGLAGALAAVTAFVVPAKKKKAAPQLY